MKADAYDNASCVLLAAAASTRVLWPLVQPPNYVPAMLCSALLWSAAFLLFIARHGPALVRRPVDA